MVFGDARGWGYRETAEFFGVPYGTFKQLVCGWTGASYARALLWQKRSRGKVRASEVLAWHHDNRQPPAAEPEVERAAG